MVVEKHRCLGNTLDECLNSLSFRTSQNTIEQMITFLHLMLRSSCNTKKSYQLSPFCGHAHTCLGLKCSHFEPFTEHTETVCDSNQTLRRNKSALGDTMKRVEAGIKNTLNMSEHISFTPNQSKVSCRTKRVRYWIVKQIIHGHDPTVGPTYSRSNCRLCNSH